MSKVPSKVKVGGFLVTACLLVVAWADVIRHELEALI